MITLDTTTRAAYNAETTVAARAQAVLDALADPVTITVYDGETEVGSGTMATPWATRNAGVLTTGEVTSFAVSQSGTPGAGWTLKFESGGAWVSGRFGLTGSGADFTWSLPTWSAGQSGRIGTVVINATDEGLVTGSGAIALGEVTVSGTGTISGSGTNTPEPTYSPLTVLYPRATGNGGLGSGTGLESSHRIYKAYPGLEYNIRAAVVGGSYPYTFALSNAPSGMTIDANTGEISWPDPDTTATDIVMTVTDSEDAEATGTWTVTVGTSGFVFVDAAAGTNGSGTLASPFNSLVNLKAGGGTNIAYFRAGTYVPVYDYGTEGGNHFASMFFGATHPTQWLAYPGETVEIDEQDAEYCIEFGARPYCDGIGFINSYCKAVMISYYTKYGMVFRRCNFETQSTGEGGHNSGFVNVRNNDDQTYPRCGSVFQDCTFTDLNGETCALKMYGMDHALIEDNVFSDSATNSEGCIAMKNAVPDITIRNNTALLTMGQPLVGGNMNHNSSYTYNACGGEVCYNNIKYGGTVDSLSNICVHFQMPINPRADFYIYRNTFNGVLTMFGFTSSDGVVTWRHNVIVNAYGSETPWAYIYDYSVSDNTRGVLEDNLGSSTTTDVIDPDTGLLTGTSRTNYLGSRGHEIP